ncbi:MAG: tetratricopeptide repeat protein [Desulfobacteraceae bacterium]|nr:tetratricopeptide repeat protein [Desulfobacteraceae bacterium]
MNLTANYRYPGSRPFQDTDPDRRLYFGREHEKESLFHMILGQRLVVLYSKSGMGKTSLLNAGVTELLRGREFFPMVIRLYTSEHDPFQAVYNEIQNSVEQSEKIVESRLEQKKTLWEYFKCLELWGPDDILLTPVLIFDQFEELFTLHVPEVRKVFIEQFADLVKNRIPGDLPESGGQPLYTETPPNVKIVISIREDFLGHLEELSRDIPDILHNCFRLLPFNREQAAQAIVNPAKLRDDIIQARPFQYADETVGAMLDFLCTRKKRTYELAGTMGKLDTLFDSGEVEPFQLQLLCQHIETGIVADSNGNGAEYTVQIGELGGEAGMQRVLQNFYDDQIKQIDSRRKKRNVVRLCEKGLISVTDRRLSLEEEDIERKFNVSKNDLGELVNKRLLRSEPRVGSTYYELSHDTLVEPIRESEKKRKKKEYLVSGICLAVFIAVLSSYIFQSFKQVEQRKRDSFYELGINSYYQKKYEEAINHFQKAIEVDHDYANAYNGLGIVFRNQKNYEEAIKHYRKAIEIGPNHAKAYYNLGNVYSDQKNYEEAIKQYRKAIEIGPNHANVYSGLGIAFRKQKNYEEAIKQYRKAIEIDPNHTNAYNNLGIAFRKQKNYEEAIKQYRKAIEIDPNYANAYCNLGNVYSADQKNYEEAVKQYQKAIEIDPSYANAYYNLGITYDDLENYEEAVKQYQKAIEIDPNIAYFYSDLAIAYSNRKNYEEAIKQYRKAIEIDPNHASFYNSLGNAYSDQKNYEEAIKQYRKAIEIDPNFAYFYRNLAITFKNRKNYEEAIKQYQKAIELDPENDSAKGDFAELCLMTEGFEEAFTIANEILKEKDNFTDHILAMKFIIVSSLLFQEKQSEAYQELKGFIEYYKSLTEEYSRGWSYVGIKKFINNYNKIKESDKRLILDLIDILESPKPEGDKKLRQLESSLPELFKE